MLKNFLNTRNGRIVLWTAVIAAIGVFMWLTAPKSPAPAPANENRPAAGGQVISSPNANAPKANANANAPSNKPAAKKPAAKAPSFTEKKAPHFVSANIANNAVISQIPSFLTLNFDAPLVKSTQTVLAVKKDDVTNAAMNAGNIDNEKLVVRLNTQMTDGSYYVYYVACFADTGCKDGRFGYRVDLP